MVMMKAGASVRLGMSRSFSGMMPGTTWEPKDFAGKNRGLP
jgi:hypothetical protein